MAAKICYLITVTTENSICYIIKTFTHTRNPFFYREEYCFIVRKGELL